MKPAPTSAVPKAPTAVNWCGYVADERGWIGKGPSVFVHFCTTWKPDQKGFQCRQHVGCGWYRAERARTSHATGNMRSGEQMSSNMVSWDTTRAHYGIPLQARVFLICPSLIKPHSRRTLR